MTRRRWWIAAAVATLAGAACVSAQDGNAPPQHRDGEHSDHSGHAEHDAGSDSTLAQQIAELRAKVARLEAALDAGHPQGGAQEGSSTQNRGDVQGMGKQRRGMGMRGGRMQGMGGMQGMGPAMGSAQSPALSRSSLPGFPGVSHLYHVGASGLFLDHAEHLQLTSSQREALNRLRQRVLLDSATSERKVGQAEQELWLLTAADQPDATTIEAKIREIATLHADWRLLQIRTVGEAAQLLTAEQRSRVTQEPNEASPTQAEPASQPAQSPR